MLKAVKKTSLSCEYLWKPTPAIWVITVMFFRATYSIYSLMHFSSTCLVYPFITVNPRNLTLSRHTSLSSLTSHCKSVEQLLAFCFCCFNLDTDPALWWLLQTYACLFFKLPAFTLQQQNYYLLSIRIQCNCSARNATFVKCMLFICLWDYISEKMFGWSLHWTALNWKGRVRVTLATESPAF